MSDSMLRHRLDPGGAQDEDDELLIEVSPTTRSPEQTRQRIINILEIYPKLSPSMLQSGLGPHNKAANWRPILESLIQEGVVKRDQLSHHSELGRYRILVILSLSDDYFEAKQKALEEMERMDREETETREGRDETPSEPSVRRIDPRIPA